CDCSGPKPTCVASIDTGNGDSLDFPQSYCSNTACTINDNTTCGDEGVCGDFAGDGNALCYRRCSKGTCRTDYACMRIFTDPNSMTSKTSALCLPKEGLVDCDPTADSTTQCTTLNGQQVSGLTNGA